MPVSSPTAPQQLLCLPRKLKPPAGYVASATSPAPQSVPLSKNCRLHEFLQPSLEHDTSFTSFKGSILTSTIQLTPHSLLTFPALVSTTNLGFFATPTPGTFGIVPPMPDGYHSSFWSRNSWLPPSAIMRTRPGLSPK